MKAIMAGVLLWGMVQLVSANPAEGTYWMLVDGDGKLQAKVIDGELQVQVIAIKPKAKDMLDKKNPDTALQKRRILGMVIMQGFRWNEKEEHWEGGTIYDPTEGKTYDAFIWSDPETGNLRVRGYVMIGWFGRTEMFERVSGPDPQSSQADEPKLVYLNE
ncbi:MAG: DUF2147 domain-containing protein [Verrucomicrobiota bacterium]